jgi:hypothetical protein
MPLEYPLGFKVDATFEAELQADPQYHRALREKAEEAAKIARLIAPHRTGDYMRSIHVREGEEGIELAADDYKAWWIEHGTREQRDLGVITPGKGTPAFAPLRRAIRRAGMDLGGGAGPQILFREPRTGRIGGVAVVDPRLRGSQLRDPKTGRIVAPFRR